MTFGDVPPALSVVIPAYNEAARISATLATIARYLAASDDSWEIRVVDDGSSDETAALVAAFVGDEPRIVLQREPHRGKGGAVRAGMLAAQGQRRVLCDADLSVPIEELTKLLARVPAHADIAIGCRESTGARRIGEPRRRHVMGRAFNALVRCTVLPDLQDTQCGFKLLTASAATAIFERVTVDGWAFDVEALLVARHLGIRVEVVPITWRYERESRVLAIRDAPRMMRDLWRILLKAARGDYARRVEGA
jgi:dolichyl-phosphate beta-glucosyltransferase